VRAAVGDRLDRAAQPCLFDRLDWFALLHGHCFADQPFRAVQASSEAGEAWLFLAEAGARRLTGIANYYSFSWSPIFLGEPDPAEQLRLLTAIARHLARREAQLDVFPVAQASAPLLTAFRQAGWLAVQRAMGARYVLPVGGRNFGAYWADRPGRLRNQVRRKARGSDLSLSIADHFTEALWADYVDVHARSWKGPEPGLSFLKALTEREGAAGTLRLGFARLPNGHAIATQIWTVEQGKALIHKLCHDRAHDAASPGTLLSHHMFARAIDDDQVTMIDYGTGNNGYKVEWMEARETLYRIDCFNPRFASSWLPAARTAISALVG